MSDNTPVLITGGAGYIGSHAVLAFGAAGHPVVALDDLSAGRREAVADGVPFVEGDAGDRDLVAEVIARHGIGAVIHFAGSIVVPESVADPLKYYRNNTCVSRTLVETCVACGVRDFVFSSTAAVYGIPEVVPVREDAPAAPINPYGASKLMTEWILRDAAAAHDFRYVALRYFNVAGADPQGRSGQRAGRPTHLIEVAVRAAAGLYERLEIYGDDFDTPDGTGVRDYIHVTDLAEAHVLALRHLAGGGRPAVLNLGNQRGFSVREVIAAVERVSGRAIRAEVAPRRPGDPACLVADAGAARRLLGWRPGRAGLETQVGDAWRWLQRSAAAAE
jgi:UDP-glucose 4-epimerase